MAFLREREREKNNPPFWTGSASKSTYMMATLPLEFSHDHALDSGDMVLFGRCGAHQGGPQVGGAMTRKRPSLCSNCHSLRNHFIFALLFLRGCVGVGCRSGGCRSGASCDWSFPLCFDQDFFGSDEMFVEREKNTPICYLNIRPPPKIRPHPPIGDGVDIALFEREM